MFQGIMCALMGTHCHLVVKGSTVFTGVLFLVVIMHNALILDKVCSSRAQSQFLHMALYFAGVKCPLSFGDQGEMDM